MQNAEKSCQVVTRGYGRSTVIIFPECATHKEARIVPGGMPTAEGKREGEECGREECGNCGGAEGRKEEKG